MKHAWTELMELTEEIKPRSELLNDLTRLQNSKEEILVEALEFIAENRQARSKAN